MARRLTWSLLLILLFALAQAGTATAQLITFAAPEEVEVGGSAAGAMVSADLNGDARLDVALLTQAAELVVLLNNRKGDLNVIARYPWFTGSVIAADVNGDGRPDLVQSGGPGVNIFMNDRTGRFLPPVSYPLPQFPGPVAAGHFFRSEAVDLAVLNLGYFGANPVLTFFRNRGDGVLLQETTFPLPDGGAYVTAADLDNDGYEDLVTGNFNTHGNMTISTLINVGPGIFAPMQTYPASEPNFITTADLDGDNFLDITWACLNCRQLFMMRNEQGGTFGEPTSFVLPDYSGGPVAAKDLDGDGRVDLAIGGGPGVWIYRNLGNGTFERNLDVSYPVRVGNLLLADLRSYGRRPDIIANNGAGTTITILQNITNPLCNVDLTYDGDLDIDIDFGTSGFSWGAVWLLHAGGTQQVFNRLLRAGRTEESVSIPFAATDRAVTYAVHMSRDQVCFDVEVR